MRQANSNEWYLAVELPCQRNGQQCVRESARSRLNTAAPLVKVIFMPSFCNSIARKYSSPLTAYCVRLIAGLIKSGCRALPSLLASDELARQAKCASLPKVKHLPNWLKTCVTAFLLIVTAERARAR